MTLQKRQQAGSLKAAQAELVARAGGVLVATRVKKTALGQYCDPNHASNMPVDVVADLEARAGEPIVTRHLAMQQRQLLIPLPAANDEPYPLALASITSETGELLSRGGEALRERRLSAQQAAFMKSQALKIASACAALIADCDDTLARGGDQ